jgi:hypothetical protein
MNPDDVHEITNLLNLYAFAVDTLQWDLFDRIFTPDVTLDYPNGSWSDLRSFKKDFAVAHAQLHTTQHMVTNHQIALRGDEANALSYARARLVRTTPEAGGEFFEFGGWYDDLLLRTAGRWRIRNRKCRGNWLDGNPDAVSPAVRDSLTTFRRAAAAGDIAYFEAVKR